MTIAEQTITMIEGLSENQLLDVQKYIKKISAPTKTVQKTKLRKYTEKEFLDLIDESIEQSKNGQVYTWKEVREATHDRYGF